MKNDIIGLLKGDIGALTILITDTPRLLGNVNYVRV